MKNSLRNRYRNRAPRGVKRLVTWAGALAVGLLLTSCAFYNKGPTIEPIRRAVATQSIDASSGGFSSRFSGDSSEQSSSRETEEQDDRSAIRPPQGDVFTLTYPLGGFRFRSSTLVLFMNNFGQLPDDVVAVKATRNQISTNELTFPIAPESSLFGATPTITVGHQSLSQVSEVGFIDDDGIYGGDDLFPHYSRTHETRLIAGFGLGMDPSTVALHLELDGVFPIRPLWSAPNPDDPPQIPDSSREHAQVLFRAAAQHHARTSDRSWLNLFFFELSTDPALPNIAMADIGIPLTPPWTSPEITSRVRLSTVFHSLHIQRASEEPAVAFVMHTVSRAELATPLAHGLISSAAPFWSISAYLTGGAGLDTSNLLGKGSRLPWQFPNESSSDIDVPVVEEGISGRIWSIPLGMSVAVNRNAKGPTVHGVHIAFGGTFDPITRGVAGIFSLGTSPNQKGVSVLSNFTGYAVGQHGSADGQSGLAHFLLSTGSHNILP